MKTMKLGILFALIAVSLFTIPAHSADFSLEMPTRSESTCPGEHVTYQLDIINEKTDKSLKISVEGQKLEWATIAPQEIRLGGGEKRSAWIFVQPHYTATPGTYNFDVVVTDGEDEMSLPLKLNVISCRQVSVSTTSASSCQESFEHSVSIRNSGTVEDIFSIKLNETWASADSEVSLQPGEEKKVPIKINGSEGNWALKINVKSKTSYPEDSTIIPVSIEKCYDLGLELKDDLTICKEQNKTVMLGITNNGTRDANYTLTAHNAILGNTNIFLRAGESKNVNLTFGQSFEVSASNHVNKTLRRNVSIIPENECHALSLNISTKSVSIEKSGNALIEGSLNNKGEFQEEVDVFGLGAPWVEIVPRNLTLDPDQNEALFIYLAPPFEVDGTYNISVITASGKASASQSINVKVVDPAGNEPKNETNKTTEMPEEKTNETPMNNSNFTLDAGNAEEKSSSTGEIIKFVISPILNLI